MISFAKFLMEGDNYSNGPMIFTREPIEGKDDMVHCVYMRPLGLPVSITGENDFSFQEHFIKDNCLMIRQMDIEEPLEKLYAKLEEYALKCNYKIKKPFYHVVLDLYGDVILDVYAEYEPQ